MITTDGRLRPWKRHSQVELGGGGVMLLIPNPQVATLFVNHGAVTRGRMELMVTLEWVLLYLNL